MQRAVTFIAVVCALLAAPSATAAYEEPPAVRECTTFNCEVCRVFCHELSEQFAHLAVDAPYDDAYRFARGNSSQYLWDAKRELLRRLAPGQDDHGTTPRVYASIDSHFGDYERNVVVKALHDTARLQTPHEVPLPFCMEQLCWHRTDMCCSLHPAAHDGKIPYANVRDAFAHFVHHYDAGHTERGRAHGMGERPATRDGYHHAETLRQEAEAEARHRVAEEAQRRAAYEERELERQYAAGRPRDSDADL
jgi:hypothetical protein